MRDYPKRARITAMVANKGEGDPCITVNPMVVNTIKSTSVIVDVCRSLYETTKKKRMFM